MANLSILEVLEPEVAEGVKGFLPSSLGEEGKEMWESKLPTFCVLFTYNMDAISR